MSLPNRYHLRRVAESSARACFICYKPSSTVLITPDNRDFFYACAIHLKDKGFCSPVEDGESAAGESAAEKKRKEELEKEIELVKKEYEEKMKKKKGKDKKKDGDGEDKKKEKKDDEDDKEAKKAEKEKDEKIKSLQTKSESAASTKANDDVPRIYTLQKTFYQMRIDRMRNIELAKRNRERMKDSSFFPSAPQSDFS